LSVAGSITSDGNVLSLADVDVLLGDGVVVELLGRLDEGRREAHLNVPFNVAVEEEDTGVVGGEAQDGVGVGVDSQDVTAGGSSAGARVATAPNTGIRGSPLDDLELMAVQVEGVDGSVQVVYNNVHSVIVVDNERGDITVESSVDVLVAEGGC
jgi:hypothetical protein